MTLTIHPTSNLDSLITFPQASHAGRLTVTHAVRGPVFDLGEMGVSVGQRARQRAMEIGGHHVPHPNPDEEGKRLALLKTLEEDCSHFQNRYAKEQQPSLKKTKLRQMRCMEPVLAMLNLSHNANLRYCEGKAELGCLLDSVSKKTGDWQGAVLVLMSTLPDYHYIGVQIYKRDGHIFAEGLDSLSKEYVGFDRYLEQFQEVMKGRQGITARYRSIPVQSTLMDCAFHALYFLLSTRDDFVRRVKAEHLPQPEQSTVKVIEPVCRLTDLIHVDSQSRLDKLPTYYRSQPLPEDWGGEEYMNLKDYHAAHMTTKYSKKESRFYDYSDSVERYRLVLLEDTVHWVKHGGARQILSALENVRPTGDNYFVRYFAVILREVKPKVTSFRHLPQHKDSEAAKFWDPDRHLRFAKMPALLDAVYLRR